MRAGKSVDLNTLDYLFCVGFLFGCFLFGCLFFCEQSKKVRCTSELGYSLLADCAFS